MIIFLKNDIWIVSELFSFLGRQIVEDVEDLKQNDVFAYVNIFGHYNGTRFCKPFNYLFVVASLLYFAIASPPPHEQEQDLKALQVARGDTRPTARAYSSYER